MEPYLFEARLTLASPGEARYLFLIKPFWDEPCSPVQCSAAVQSVPFGRHRFHLTEARSMSSDTHLSTKSGSPSCEVEESNLRSTHDWSLFHVL